MTSLVDYELGETLGQGAFGRTVAATQRATGRAVAVKLLRLSGLPDWKPVELLEREAKVLRSLVHPGIPAFVEAFEDHGDAADGAGAADEKGEPAEVQLCIVTERVAGETLAAKLERGDRWTAAQAERLTRELLEILAYLHELSPPVVHRDVTPANVMIDEGGRAMLVDFGAVRSIDYQPGQAQTVLGTPGYMAPEQAMGEATPASDLYGLGATLAHVLSAPVAAAAGGLRIGEPGRGGGGDGSVLPGLLAECGRVASARAARPAGRGRLRCPRPAALPAAAGPGRNAARRRWRCARRMSCRPWRCGDPPEKTRHGRPSRGHAAEPLERMVELDNDLCGWAHALFGGHGRDAPCAPFLGISRCVFRSLSGLPALGLSSSAEGIEDAPDAGRGRRGTSRAR